MNSTPNSAVYKFITKSKINLNNFDYKFASGQKTCISLYQDYKSKSIPNIQTYIDKLFTNTTCDFDEKSVTNITRNNISWLKEILNTHLEIECFKFDLKYDAKEDKEINQILESKTARGELFTMRSAYAENAKNLCDNFFSKPYNKNKSIYVYGYQTLINSYKNLTYEPPYTFYADDLIGTLDYIFFDGNMSVARTLDVLNLEKLMNDYPFLPNLDFGSDHICIGADFILKQDNKKGIFIQIKAKFLKIIYII